MGKVLTVTFQWDDVTFKAYGSEKEVSDWGCAFGVDSSNTKLMSKNTAKKRGYIKL